MGNDSPHDILLLLGRIEGKLDAVIKRMDKLDDTITNHEQRIVSLEKAQARFKGGTTIVVTLFSVITAVAAVLLRFAHG